MQGETRLISGEKKPGSNEYMLRQASSTLPHRAWRRSSLLLSYASVQSNLNPPEPCFFAPKPARPLIHTSRKAPGGCLGSLGTSFRVISASIRSSRPALPWYIHCYGWGLNPPNTAFTISQSGRTNTLHFVRERSYPKEHPCAIPLREEA